MNERTYGAGFHSVYKERNLTLGIGVPIEAYQSPVPEMQNQIELIQRAESGGFAAVWCRDVPLLDPTFGDAGQMYDPWVWLGYVAAQTTTIALGTGSIILPLRQPLDLAKAASSVDQLSKGRLIAGVATGDRPVEYSAYDVAFEPRDESFRNTIELLKKTTHKPQNWHNQMAVQSRQLDILPKSYAGDIPLFVTGNSRQSIEWIAENADGWLMYPRPVSQQQLVLQQWQQAVSQTGKSWKPFSQSLYVDLTDNLDTPPVPIHLGYKLGRNHLTSLLEQLREIGVNHVTFNIRFSSRPVPDVLDELIEFVVPQFPRN